MRTVKDISDETGVSVQTVYRRLNKISQKSKEVLIEKIDGITYFTEIGEKLILDSLTDDKQSLNTGKQPESGEILFLREQIKELNAKNDALSKELTAEREHSRNQADEITSLAKDLSRLTENGQVLLREQNLKALSPPEPEKVSLWNKLFKRKG